MAPVKDARARAIIYMGLLLYNGVESCVCPKARRPRPEVHGSATQILSPAHEPFPVHARLSVQLWKRTETAVVIRTRFLVVI